MNAKSEFFNSLKLNFNAIFLNYSKKFAGLSFNEVKRELKVTWKNTNFDKPFTKEGSPSNSNGYN